MDMPGALMVPLGVFNSIHGEQDCTAWLSDIPSLQLISK